MLSVTLQIDTTYETKTKKRTFPFKRTKVLLQLLFRFISFKTNLK